MKKILLGMLVMLLLGNLAFGWNEYGKEEVMLYDSVGVKHSDSNPVPVDNAVDGSAISSVNRMPVDLYVEDIKVSSANKVPVTETSAAAILLAVDNLEALLEDVSANIEILAGSITSTIQSNTGNATITAGDTPLDVSTNGTIPVDNTDLPAFTTPDAGVVDLKLLDTPVSINVSVTSNGTFTYTVKADSIIEFRTSVNAGSPTKVLFAVNEMPVATSYFLDTGNKDGYRNPVGTKFKAGDLIYFLTDTGGVNVVGWEW